MQELRPELTPGQLHMVQARKQIAETVARQKVDRAASGAMWALAGLCFLVSGSMFVTWLFGGVAGLSIAIATLGVWSLITAVILGRRA